MEKFLTVKEVSEALHLGKTNTYKLFQRRDFPKITIGKKLLVKESELDGYIEKYSGAIIDI
ncbi:MAG: helix-turn-helix domain-containing protein [Lachnospiraceae bacterium]|nr:helix-turn-helix domain-containing protein [Lachnospiraceae bacterium]